MNKGKPPQITWKGLCALEPRLLALYKQARAVKDDHCKPSFCANAVWYGRGDHDGIKPILLDLVGYRRMTHPILGTCRAYDIAYRKIYDALPNCRNCCCVDLHAVIASRLASAPACGAKERPRCRRVIIEDKLRPHIEGGKWTGWAVGTDGKRIHLGGGLKTQMRLMIAQGFFESGDSRNGDHQV